MNTCDLDQAIAPLARILRIIVLAMTLGTGLFLGVAVVLQATETGIAGRTEGMPIISYAALVFVGMSLVVRVVLPSVIATSARKRIAAGTWKAPSGQIAAIHGIRLDEAGDAGKLIPALMIQTIVSAAVVEAATVFAIFAYLLEGQIWAAGVAGAMVIILTFQIPTEFTMKGWIENQARRLEQASPFRA